MRKAPPFFFLLVLIVLSSGLAVSARRASAAEASLLVRASPEAAPCVEAASEAWTAKGRVDVETGGLRDPGAWDVLVGSSVELTRALEGGDADPTSDVDIAEIPWVLHATRGSPVRSLVDLGRPGVETVILGGPAAYEVRRALAEKGITRVLETTDPGRLRSASVALLPLSLVGPGERVRVDVPPIRVGAAVGARARHAAAAGRFVQFLGSERGQQAFAACVPVQ
jgi:hypothetical protein